MKIVSRKELMALPAGTLYHEWEPCYFKHLCIKGETIPAKEGYRGDWYQHDVPSLAVRSSGEDIDVQTAMDEKGLSHPVDMHCESREALYDDKLRYAVWEYEDVKAFYARLGACMGAFDR